MYKIVVTNQAEKDAKKAASSNLKPKILQLVDILRNNPFQPYPEFEKLIGEEIATYSRRINKQHRLVYQVYEAEKTVKILRMWTHYE